MRRRKSFWRQIREKLEDFFIKQLDRFGVWIDAITDWFEDLVKVIAKEATVYILWIVCFGFGAFIYVAEKYISLEETHHYYLSKAGIAISLGSIFMVVIHILKHILQTLGLLEPVIKLRDSILSKLNLL